MNIFNIFFLLILAVILTSLPKPVKRALFWSNDKIQLLILMLRNWAFLHLLIGEQRPSSVVIPIGNKVLEIHSGTLAVHFKGTGADWRRDTVNFFIPTTITYKEQISSSGTFVSISNQGPAVDGVRAYPGPYPPGNIVVDMYCALRDVDGWIHGISYQVIVFGSR